MDQEKWPIYLFDRPWKMLINGCRANYNANIDNLLRVISRGVLEESMLISRRVSRVGLIMAEANSATRPIKRLFLIERLY